MSIKSGSKFIAGNLALRVQDRLFTAVRTLEGSQEYYDIIVPVGVTLGFTEGTRLMIIIDGTNTTTTPILRYGATQFYMVSSATATHEARIGELRDTYLIDMFIKSLNDVKPSTSIPLIYLGRTASDYSHLTNIPSFIGRNLTQKPLFGGSNFYTDLGLPYIEGNNLVVNDVDVLSINIDNLTFISPNRLKWRSSVSNVEELATLKDIQELAIADQFVDVLVYSRDTIAEMDEIDDKVLHDTCLVLENNTIYSWNNSEWEIQEVLDYNLTTDNGKYFDIEDIDGTNSGKAIWNIVEGGKFRIFTDYTNSIDGVTIIRNSVSRAIEVAKVPNQLTINNLDADGEITDTTVFDGSIPRTFNVTVDLSKHYTKTELDSWYNGATPGHIGRFFTDEDENVKLQDAGIAANDLVTKLAAGTFLQAQGSNVNASMVAFGEGSVATFLDQNFALTDFENDFIVGQKIAGELIATRDWTQNTFLANNFNLNLVTGAEIQLNSPSAGRTSLRFARTNISTGVTNNLDIELPLVNGSNNGLVSPTQVANWNTVSDKVNKQHINGDLVSNIGYSLYETPVMTAGYSDRFAEISILDDGATNGLRASLLSVDITEDLVSGILADKSGVYAFQVEGVSKDNAHRIATEGYVEQNVVLQDDIVTDSHNQWSGNKVVLGAIDFTTIGASSATYRQFGSNVATGAEVTFDRAFPIVTSTLAGLATAGMFNQVETNRIGIESLQGQGQVGAELPQPPTQTDIQNAWDTAKPEVPSLEGCSVIDLITGNTWRLLDVEGVLTWVNLGVLGGTGQATNATTGVVKGSASGPGTIFVENDATMVVNGWDDLLSDVENLDLGLGTLDTNYTAHIADINFGNTAPHVTTQNRTDWNKAKTTADNAIPKVAAAVNNNLTMWSSGGVLKDSLLSVVTGFTTPTDSQIPTAKAVFDNMFLKIGGTITGETTISNNNVLKLLELRNQDPTQYSRMMFTGSQKQFTLGVGNHTAGITELRNKFYAYDFSTTTPIFYGDQAKMKFSGRVGVANAIDNDDAVNKGLLNNKLQTVSDEATAETQSLANPDNFYFYEEE